MVQFHSHVVLLILAVVISYTLCVPYYSLTENPKEIRNIVEPLQVIFNDTEHNVNKSKISTKRVPKRLFSIKKIHVGRFSQKQYEIVNMLWRKTKIFMDEALAPTNSTTKVYSTTKKYNPQRKLKNETNSARFARRPRTSSTESFIEFYYLDENGAHLIEKSNEPQQSELNYNKDFSKGHYPNSVLTFRTKLPLSPISSSLKRTKFRRDNFQQSMSHHESNSKLSEMIPSQRRAKNNLENDLSYYLRKYFFSTTDEPIYTYETCPLNTEPISNSAITTESTSNNMLKLMFPTNITTFYDKIKFFELYDRHTEEDEKVYFTYIHRVCDQCNSTKTPNFKNASVSHLDVKHAQKNRLAKKHVLNSDMMNNLKDKSLKSLITTKIKSIQKNTPIVEENKNSTRSSLKQLHIPKLCNGISCKLRNSSKKVLWLEYPFAAVYIYEPSQVHCDAAGISPHWLITAASCLSRHRLREPEEGGRSAFVTYCGVYWQIPERMAYVKYSLIHPNYHPTENSRRYMYNIGLINVVSSMAACNGWSPVLLMSHQYSTSQQGSLASAVGWGLDRYVSRSNRIGLIRPLMEYKGIVYSDLCPGNSGYNKVKFTKHDNSIRHIYCLSLPPYVGEKNDPVHGSILLVEGKLIALYLQEERRSQGEQSAIYTSIWRLIPWVHDIAREPDVDVFTAEI